MAPRDWRRARSRWPLDARRGLLRSRRAPRKLTTQAIWSVVAAPLIMGNDLRNVSDAMKALLQNH